MDLSPQDSLGFQVRRCHRAFEKVLNEQLSHHGLTAGFWGFLRALWQENGATQKRLSQLNNVTEPTAVTTLNAMDEMGLIRRERNPDDRRKLNVFLSPKAERMKGDLVPLARRINAIAGEGIEPEDLRTTLRVLQKMAENLSKEADDVA